MKKYEFHSALPPEMVFARLSVRAKPDRPYGTHWLDGEEFFYTRKGERFSLSYSGTFPARGFIPFRGTVRAEGSGSVITGSFSLSWEEGTLLAVMGGVFLILGLCLRAPLLPLLLMTSAWSLFMIGFLSLLQIVFFRGRRKYIIKFIEENLLK